MENNTKLICKVIGVTAIAMLIILIILLWFDLPQIAKETALGYALCLVIFTSAFISINWTISKSLTTFMAALMIGMVFRFIILGAALFLLLRYTQFNVMYVILSFFVFYLIFQYFEINFINKSISNGREIFKSIIKG